MAPRSRPGPPALRRRRSVPAGGAGEAGDGGAETGSGGRKRKEKEMEKKRKGKKRKEKEREGKEEVGVLLAGVEVVAGVGSAGRW